MADAAGANSICDRPLAGRKIPETSHSSMTKRIALTGGIACGKSALARFLSEQGCDVWDADAVVHAVEAPGGAAVQPLVEAFGAGVRMPDGGIDRCVLGARVFADPAALAQINAIVHPLVRIALEGWSCACGGRLKVAVIPLLFEVGWDHGWDAVVCVTSTEEMQVQRLLKRGLSRADAQARLAAQMPVQEKARRADYVIQNDGDLSDLYRAAAQWLETFVGPVGKGRT